MPTASSDAAIRTRIESFLAELSELVRLAAALGSVHAALGGEPAPGQRRGRGRPGGSGVSRRATSRAVAPAGKRLRRSPADLAKLQSSLVAPSKVSGLKRSDVR